MPIVEIPGHGQVEFPDYMSDMEISEAIKRDILKTDSGKTQEAPSGWWRGIRDPLDALSQMGEAVIPESWAKNINKFNNWLVDKGVPLERMPEGGFDQWIRDDEAKYQAARQAAGETGIDWDRIGGNIISPINAVAASKVPKLLSAASKTSKLLSPLARPGVQASIVGGGSGLLTPVTQGDLGEEKLKQTGMGMITGLGTQKVGSGISRVIKPKSSPQVQKLWDEGIVPTPGDALGGAGGIVGRSAKTIEDASTSVPFLGDMIKHRKTLSNIQFNRAVLNRALKPLGKKLDDTITPNKEGLIHVYETISDSYDDLLPKLKGKMDKAFMNKMKKIEDMSRSMPKDKEDHLKRILNYEVYDRFTESGLASGRTLKRIESRLGKLIRDKLYSRNSSPDDKDLGNALREVQRQLRLMIVRNNPKYKNELKKLNRAYASYLKAENAHMTVMTPTRNGFITPSDYERAVKNMSASKRQYAHGKAHEQDLSSAAKGVLQSNIRDSGTGTRVATTVGLAGATMFNPSALIGPALAAVPYLPGASQAISYGLSRRPEFFSPIASGVNRISQGLIPGLSQESARSY